MHHFARSTLPFSHNFATDGIWCRINPRATRIYMLKAYGQVKPVQNVHRVGLNLSLCRVRPGTSVQRHRDLGSTSRACLNNLLPNTPACGTEPWRANVNRFKSVSSALMRRQIGTHGPATSRRPPLATGIVNFQYLGRWARFRQPCETSLEKTLLSHPISLSIIAEQPNRRSSPTPEQETQPVIGSSESRPCKREPMSLTPCVPPGARSLPARASVP